MDGLHKFMVKKFNERRKEKIPILNLFSKKDHKLNNKPTAIVFVDYEHWYISMEKFFGEKPNIRQWRNELSERYNVTDIMFFADFSNPSLRAEIQKIREVTSYIIETQTASQYHKKDYTDFIMLDHIYQRAMTSDGTDVFVIFSGDGHFSSVISFLVNRCGKTVCVYGIKDALSMQLRNTANITVEWPPNEAPQTKTISDENITDRNKNKSPKKMSDETQGRKKSDCKNVSKNKSFGKAENDSEKKAIPSKNRKMDDTPKTNTKKSDNDIAVQKRVSNVKKQSVAIKSNSAELSECCRCIIKNMRYFEKNNTGDTKICHTVEGTVDSVASYYKFERGEVLTSIISLYDMGYLTSNEKRSTLMRQKGTIKVNWATVYNENVI